VGAVNAFVRVAGSRVGVAVLAASVTAVVVGGFAVASIPDSNGVIKACRNKQACAHGEKPLQWNQRGQVGPPGPKGEPGLAGASGLPGSLVAKPADAITGLSLRDDTWTDVPGVSTTVSVPSGKTALFVIRWAGVSNPNTANLTGLELRLLVDDTEPLPANDNGVYFGVHIALERSLPRVAEGTHTVKLQAKNQSCGGCSQQDNFSSSHLTIETALAP
jgi:hypothetical protein